MNWKGTACLGVIQKRTCYLCGKEVSPAGDCMCSLANRSGATVVESVTRGKEPLRPNSTGEHQ